VWGTTNKGSKDLEPIIIWDRKLGSWDGSMVRKAEENVIQRKNLRNTVPVLCALKKWLWNADGWTRRWTVKLVRHSGRMLNGAPQFVGRPERELHWQAGCDPTERQDFLPARFCGASHADLLLSRRLPRLFLHVRDPFVMPHYLSWFSHSYLPWISNSISI